MAEEFNSSVIHMEVTEDELKRMQSLQNDEKYQSNLKDLDKYKDSYKEDFLKLKEDFEMSLNRMENEIDYGALTINESFKKEGVDLGVDI